MSPTFALGLLLCTAVLYDFVNGFHDGANIVSTVIASRSMGARGALLLAAGATFAGPFLLGVAVAHTIGAEVLDPGVLTISVAVAAMVAASLWDLATWWLGIPVSSSHALVGGLIGAAVAGAGADAIQPGGVAKIAVALLVSPLAGFLGGLGIMFATLWLLRNATPRANLHLSRAQIATATALALANGANDAQKTVGVVALGLLLLGVTPTFFVPWWAIALSAASLSLGTALGGERIVRTLGARFYRIRPIHGFASQVSSSAVILAASLAGGPVSSTQVVSLSIVGAGAGERRSKVRWSVLAELAVAWVLTVPAAALLALPVYWATDGLLRRGGL